MVNSVNVPLKLSTTSVLAKQCRDDSKRWFGDSAAPDNLVHHTLALCGEVGELANLIKKWDRGSIDLRDAKTKHEVAMEVADVFTYLLNLSALMNIDLEAVYAMKRMENERRFTEQRKEREARRGNGQR